ncbi:MAG: hypothetical protein PHY56_06985 [Candidatus Omnitrophica bacterium]|nr:hypothetical protein [Candidatus Omnitrophota bacterium]
MKTGYQGLTKSETRAFIKGIKYKEQLQDSLKDSTCSDSIYAHKDSVTVSIKEKLDILFKSDYACTLQEQLIKRNLEEACEK